MGPYRKTASRLAMQDIRPGKSVVNDAKVSDHHAIIPTEQYVQLEHMSNEERRIYDLVVRRFLAVLSPACEYEETTLSGSIEKRYFTPEGAGFCRLDGGNFMMLTGRMPRRRNTLTPHGAGTEMPP